MGYIHTKNVSNEPSLVICPLSVLRNWQEEIKRFAPGLKSFVYVGDKEEREATAQKIKQDRKKGKLQFQVLITTYETALIDASFLQKFSWHLLVFDEAHRLKNIESLLHKSLTGWHFDKKYLLTGTPVQNNLRELYALISFISPEKFSRDDCEDFVEKFSDVEETGAKELHKLLQPILLRRTKTVILKDLPQKSEVILFHKISKLQAKLYKGILTKDLDVFENEYSMKTQTSLMNILMQLRKCVNHPYLFDGVEPEPFVLGDHLIEASGKLVLIDKLLDYLKATGHKVLLFSQMTHMLDILQDYLEYKGYMYERLDGSVRGEERFLAIQKFNQDDETFVFLLSTRAGGQGINLTSADTVVFVDSDFNPQNDLQAASRAHRIGQTRPVKIIRLIGQNTVEEIILKRAEEKKKLTEKVIEEGQFSLELSKQAMFTDAKVKLQDILMFGVDELMKEGGDEETDLDYKKFLGATVGGEWQPEEEGEEVEEKEKSQSLDFNSVPQSLYVFEGTDYSNADKKAFDDLVSAEKAVQVAKLSEAGAGERPLRSRQTVLMGQLPAELIRKPRKKLSPEEIEARRQKNADTSSSKSKISSSMKSKVANYSKNNISQKKKQENSNKNVVMKKYGSCEKELKALTLENKNSEIDFQDRGLSTPSRVLRSKSRRGINDNCQSSDQTMVSMAAPMGMAAPLPVSTPNFVGALPADEHTEQMRRVRDYQQYLLPRHEQSKKDLEETKAEIERRRDYLRQRYPKLDS